jgi:hypothetical protein
MLKTKTKLLTEKEKKICEELARIEAGQSSLRAAALLAVNKGATHAQAAEQTGLTPGQVTYAVASFRKRKIALFGVDIVDQVSRSCAAGQAEGGVGTGERQKEAVGEITAPGENLKTKKEKKTMAKAKKEEEKKAKKKAAKKKEKSTAKIDKKALKAKEKKAAKKKEKKAKKKAKVEKKTKKDKSTKKQKRTKKKK